MNSRATTKPTTAAPASAMPGLLRTKLRVSSISSSGSLRRDLVRDILDRAGGAARIIAIFLAEPLIDPAGGVADHLRDVGESFGRALESLGDEAAGLVAGLARQICSRPLAEAIDEVVASGTVRVVELDRSSLGVQRSPVD